MVEKRNDGQLPWGTVDVMKKDARGRRGLELGLGLGLKLVLRVHVDQV